jgi:RNA polymerase sigma-70 factor (ECF subfamily)
MAKQALVDEFIALYAAHESRLRGYVLTLVPRWADAEEICQRCSFVLWKKFEQFEPGTNFYAWACRVALFEVKEFRRKIAKERLIFSDELLESVAGRAIEIQDEFPRRAKALQKCVEELSRNQRELLRLRYDEGRSVGSVARLVNRPIDGVYKALSRIRQALYFCINARLEAGEI